MVANVQAALAALMGVGANNVVVSAPSGQASNLQITWTGLLNLAAQPPIASSDLNDAVFTNYQYANAALTGNPPAPAPYNGSKGNWRFDNIVVHGDPTWLDPTSQASWSAATSTLTVTGPSRIIADPGSDEPIISAAGAAAQLTVNPTVGNQDIHIGGIELSGARSMDVKPLGTGHFALVVGVATQANPALSIDSASKLNLENNDLIIHNGSLSATTALIATGANGGAWNGNGIFSSNAASKKNTELGVESNTNGPSIYDGETVAPTDVLVVYTFDGATNFSTRSVNAGDYITIDNGFVNHLTDFADGDLNYDGVINGDDYTLIDNAFNTQLASPLAIAAPAVATNAAQIAKPATPGQAIIAQSVTTAARRRGFEEARGQMSGPIWETNKDQTTVRFCRPAAARLGGQRNSELRMRRPAFLLRGPR